MSLQKMIQFQHTACSVDVPNSILTLYGRTNEGSAAIHTKIEPHLICGKDPRYVSEIRTKKITEVKYAQTVSGSYQAIKLMGDVDRKVKYTHNAIPETATVRVVKGNDIVAWGQRSFYKVYFKSVIDFFV